MNAGRSEVFLVMIAAFDSQRDRPLAVLKKKFEF